MVMPRFMKLTQAEFDTIVNDKRCTLAHKLVIAGRIERGEWEIIDKGDEKSDDKDKKTD
ncbi:MAG: hypothetical protein PHI15_03185 [Methanomicrobium sp.]|nr:hypothetical protein [Methanomicrobium sp.]